MARFLLVNPQDLGRSTDPTWESNQLLWLCKIKVSRPNQRISPNPPRSVSRHVRVFYIRYVRWFLQSLSVDKLCGPLSNAKLPCRISIANGGMAKDT